MDFAIATKCVKFELLRDVAAMANAGGGCIVIGRNNDALETGSLSEAQAQSFETTKFHTFVKNYLEPKQEYKLVRMFVGDDLLVIIDVPDFDTIPLVFNSAGNCGSNDCRKPHFLPGDLMIRTAAAETTRISSADEMRGLINLSVQKTGDRLVTEIQRMLRSPMNVEEPLVSSPYDEEYEHEERDFFGPAFYPQLPTHGYFDMTIRPVIYNADRIALRDVPRRIVEYSAIIMQNGRTVDIPFDNADQQNFKDGARLSCQKPEWRKVERVSLHKSGLYRIKRAFAEDYLPNTEHPSAQRVELQRELSIDYFVDRVTMFHVLARNIARRLLPDLDDELQFDFRIVGLAGRILSSTRLDPLEEFLAGMNDAEGNENIFNFPLRTTRRALEVDIVNIARERCDLILWTFGIRDASVSLMQRRLLGRTEPIALP